jgi:tRNA/rRNA methyltransferase
MVNSNTALTPIVILMEPQLGENIGAAARSMKNFGLSELRIVNPRDGWPNAKAEEMAKNAVDVIHHAHVYPTLAEACEDIHTLYATTARPRDMVKPSYTARKTAECLVSDQEKQKQAALLFGPERSGLDNDSITLATAICTIPISDAYPSINLAQAVTITCYEWFQQVTKQTQNSDVEIENSPASKADLHHFLEHLENELDNSRFFQAEHKRPKMIRNIRNIFTRTDFTEQEIRTLRGIVRALSEH